MIQVVGALLGIATGVVGLITFITSFWTARGDNQRALRERLRQQLRQMDIACHVYFRREGWTAVTQSPTFSFQALDQIHEDGLLSPSKSHVRRLTEILGEMRSLQESLSTPPTLDSIFATTPPEVRRDIDRRMNIAFSVLDRDSHRYLRAIGKMDNAGLGGYSTYLRYRLIRARR